MKRRLVLVFCLGLLDVTDVEAAENIGNFNGNGNIGSFNGNGNAGSFNGNGNAGSFNGNANCGSGNGNRFSSDGNGNGQGVPEWCQILNNLNSQLGLPPGTIPDFE